MEIKVEDPRKERPQGIPENIWHKVFKGELSDNVIRAMQAQGEELDTVLQGMQSLHLYEKERVLLGVALASPHLEFDILRHYAKELDLDTSSLWLVLVRLNNTKISDQMLERITLFLQGKDTGKKTVWMQWEEAVNEAADLGHAGILEQLLGWMDDNKTKTRIIIDFGKYNMLRVAVAKSDLETIKVLINALPLAEAVAMLKSNHYLELRRLMRRGVDLRPLIEGSTDLKNAIDLQKIQDLDKSELYQIRILTYALEDASNGLGKESEVYKLIEETKNKLRETELLEDAIVIANRFIFDLEQMKNSADTVAFLKKHGFYRILYRNPKILLQEDKTRNKAMRMGFVGIGISLGIIALFAVTAFFTAPLWLTAIATGLFVGASIFLSVVLFVVVKNILLAQNYLISFMVGPPPHTGGILRTNNRLAQGIAWGIADSFVPSCIAAVVFTIVAMVIAFFTPVALFVLPIVMLLMPLLGLAASVLDVVTTRDLLGYSVMDVVGVFALISLALMSGLTIAPLFMVAIPVACAALVGTLLLAGGRYVQENRDKQFDDRYRFAFDEAEVNPDLYLKEDKDYVQELMTKYGKQVEPAVSVEEEKLDVRLQPQGDAFFEPKQGIDAKAEFDDDLERNKHHKRT